MTLLRHAPDKASLTPHEKDEYWQVIEQLDRMYEQQLGTDLVTYCWLMNNAFRVPDPSPMCMGIFDRGMVERCKSRVASWTDPEFGEHHQREKTKIVPTNFLREIRAALFD